MKIRNQKIEATKYRLDFKDKEENTKKNIVFILSVIFLIGFVSADILSVNSGGDNHLIISSGAGIEDFFFDFNLRPLMNNVVLSSTFGTNLTTENLSVTYISSDPDGDVITNIPDWRFNDSSIAVLNMPFDSYKVQGTVRDYSSYENNGILGGGVKTSIPVWSSGGKVGGCYRFDGVDDYVNLGNELGLEGLQKASMGVWVKIDSFSSSTIISNYGGGNYRFNIGTISGNKIFFQVNNGASSYGYVENLEIDKWYYLTLVFDGTQIGNENRLKGYIGGIQQSLIFVGTIPSALASNSLNSYVGLTLPATEPFNGSIDEVKIYNRDLSPEQIELNYQAGLLGHSFETLVSQETDKGEVWQVAMTSNDGFYDSETILSNELTIVNNAPFDPEPVLVSVDRTNESDADLNCSSFIYDGDSDNLDVAVRWYKNNILNLTMNYNNDYSNGSLFYSILDSNNLTLGDVWKCEMRVYDESDNSSWVESNNLTIIDITNPLVYIVSPEPINYSSLNVSFNVSIIENENVSICVYSLDGLNNVTMNELNDSYFWYEPILGPGLHDVVFYCNDTSGNWGMNETNFTIDNEAAIAILLSDDLSWAVKWAVVNLPIDDLDAEGNNLDNSTDYFINISAINTLVDLYVRANGNLQTIGLDVIGLGNETYSVSSNDSKVNVTEKLTMTTNYTLIGSSMGDNSTIFMKFFLDAQSGQAAGEYLNQLDFKAVREGQLP